MQNWCILMCLVSASAWPKRFPSNALPKDATTKVDKDANFNILTSEMYRKVNALKAENRRVQKKQEKVKKLRKKK